LVFAVEVDAAATRSRRFRPGRGGCGFGCGGFLVVLTLGIALSLFNADIGIGLSIRVPFTQANATVAAAIGAKGKAADALPDYTHGRLGGNQNLINGSQTLTIGPAEGATVGVLGKQDGAPVVDLHIVVR
jgi:hypothetical protein